jgi:hypothetical protein
MKNIIIIALLITGTLQAQNNTTCIPTVENSDVARIKIIKIGDKKYVTHGSKGYHDWTETINIPLKAGNIIPIRMQPQYMKSTQVDVYWKLWIDYNQDGDFDEYNEYACYGKGKGSIYGNIHIPFDVLNGETTMRVAISTDHYPTIACDYIESGEVEDYRVTILNGTECNPVTTQRGSLQVRMPSTVNNKVKKQIAKARITVKEVEMSITPNPTISRSLVTTSSDVDKISVHNVTGAIATSVSIHKHDNNHFTIDVRSAPAGMYTVTAYIGDNLFTEKVIVVK